MLQGPMLRVAGNPAESRPDRREARARQNDFRLALVKPALEPIAPVPEEKKRLDSGFVECSRLGFLERVKEFHGKGADVNARDVYGRTALMRAAFNGHLDVVEFLLENHADVNAKDRDGWTALMYASFSFHAQIMERLISKGADANAFDNEMNSVLEISSRRILSDRKEEQRKACDTLRRSGAVDYSDRESADLV